MNSNTNMSKSENFGRSIINLLMVVLVIIAVLGCNATSGFKTKRERDHDRRTTSSTKTTPTANSSSSNAVYSQLATTLVKLSGQIVQNDNAGDRIAMARLLADDFYHENANGRIDKQQFLDSMSKDKTFVSATIKEGILTENDDSTAILAYELILRSTDKTSSTNCQDTYVNRGGTWLLKTFVCSN